MATKQELIERTRAIMRQIRNINEEDDAIAYPSSWPSHTKHDIPEWTAIGIELESIKAGCAQDAKMDTTEFDQQLWDLGILCQKYSEYALIHAMTIAEPLKDHSHVRIHGQSIATLIR